MEGTRRLAVVLGMVGIIIGGFASYIEMQPVLSQRARHNRFEQLANSAVVQQERKALQAQPNDWKDVPNDKWAKYAENSNSRAPQIDPRTGERIQAVPDFIPDDPIQDFIALPREQQLSRLRQLSPEAQDKLLAEVKRRGENSGASQYNQSIPESGLPEEPRRWEIDDATGKPELSQVNSSTIKTIHWTESLGVESIETEDGETLYPSPSPGIWKYLVISLFPIFGFLIPWGAVRAIGWVGAGFAATPK